MKKYLFFCQLALAPYISVHAQISFGAEGIASNPDTDLYFEGITFNSSSAQVFDNNVLTVENTAAPGNPPGITRIYQFSAPFTFSGRIGMFYQDSELNNNQESALVLNYGTPSYVSTITTGNQVLNYLYSDVTAISLDRVTAAAPGALPVSLARFEVEEEGGQAVLFWQTAREAASDFFGVQKSTDARTWREIARVNASRNSNTLQTYTHTDSDPGAPVVYYRLAMFDQDGTHAFSQIRTLRPGDARDMTIYPNPTADKLHLTGNQLLQTSLINFYQSNGTMVKSLARDTGNREVDLSQLPTGNYIVEFIDKNGNATIKRIVKK